MVPVIELRGGIPFGVSAGLPIWTSFAAAVSGNILIGIIIISTLEPVLNKLGRFGDKISGKFRNKTGKISARNKMLGIAAFIAVPLPLTGVWTGAAIAVFMKLTFWKSVIAVSIGTIISGLAMLCITYFFANHAAYIFWGFCVAAAILTAVFFIQVLNRKDK
jgi:uncharacterized membrane protein